MDNERFDGSPRQPAFPDNRQGPLSLAVRREGRGPRLAPADKHKIRMLVKNHLLTTFFELIFSS